MTTEIDAEGLAAAHAAVARRLTDPTVDQEFDTVRLAITAYLATTRTSEAEPVADPSFANALRDSEVRIWINTCNHEPARQALRQLLAYRVRGVSQPLRPTPASDDQVEAAARALYEEDDPWNAAFPWPNPSDGPERAEAYRRLARKALAAMGSTKPAHGKRETFVIPDGHEAVLDSHGRATGETQPAATVRGEEG